MFALLLPIVFVGVYSSFTKQPVPSFQKEGKIQSAVLFLCRTARSYPVNTQIQLGEYARTILRKIGESITERILYLLREEDEKSGV